MVSTRGVRYKFSEGERVLCYEPDPTKAKVLYDSKVLEVIENKDKRGRRTIEYLIHFQGWNSSWDRCVGEDFVLKDTEENRQLQRDLAEKSQLQLGAYLYRRERKKGSTSGSAGSSAAKRSRHRFSDDGSSSSTQPDEPENEEAVGGEPEPDAENSQESPEEEIKEEIESDSSESSENEPRAQPGSPPEHVPAPVGRAHLTMPAVLRDRLTFDYHLIVKRNRLTRLPASPCAAQILESFVKWFARAGAWHTPRCRNEPPQKPDLADVSRRLNLVREVADGMRVYFDFIMRGNLLYKPELAQYHQVCGQFLDQQERKMKEELESDGMSQDEYEDDIASAEEDMKSPKIPEYSHLPPDPIQAPDTQNGNMMDVNHIKQEIKEEPEDVEEDSEMTEEIDSELQEEMQEAMHQEMQEGMEQEELPEDEEMQQHIKEEIEDQEEYQDDLQDDEQEEESQEDIQDEEIQEEIQEDVNNEELIQVIKQEIEEEIHDVIREEYEEILQEKEEEEKEKEPEGKMKEQKEEEMEQEEKKDISDVKVKTEVEDQEMEEIKDEKILKVEEAAIIIKQEKEDSNDSQNSQAAHEPEKDLENKPDTDVQCPNEVEEEEDTLSQAVEPRYVAVDHSHEVHHSREGLRSQTSESHHIRESLRSHVSEGHHTREGLRSQSMEGHHIREGLRSQSMEGHHSPRSPIVEDSFANTVRRELHRPNTRSRRGNNSPAIGNNSPVIERGNNSPSVQRGNNSPNVQRGNKSPNIQRGNISPSVQRGNNSPSVQRGNNSPSVHAENNSPAIEDFPDRVEDPHSFANAIRNQINRPATRGQRRRWNNSPAPPANEEAPSSSAASTVEAPLITEIKQEPDVEANRPATRTRTRSGNRRSINSATNSPAINSPSVSSPVVDSPMVDLPAVNSPAVDTPAVNSPTVDSPAINSFEETPEYPVPTEDVHHLIKQEIEIKQEPRDPETSRPATRSGNVARRLRSHKSAVSQSENEEPQPSTSTAEPRNFEHSSSVGSGSGSSNEEWSKPAEPATPSTSTRTPLSLLLDKVSKYEIIPREGTEHLPCRVYGAIHLARLFVRLPDFLNATQMSDFKLKLVVKHIDMFIQYLVEHKEWFGEKFYYCDSMSRST